MRIYKTLVVVIVLLALNNYARAQSGQPGVQTIWESYAVQNFNVLLPKAPVVVRGGDNCKGEEKSTYAAFSDGVVYVLTDTHKVKPGKFCDIKKDFDEDNYKDRFNAVKTEWYQATYEESAGEVKFSKPDRVLKIINDYKNKRWFELQAFGANESKIEVDRFLNSLDLAPKVKGKSVGGGALVNFGDSIDEKSDLKDATNSGKALENDQDNQLKPLNLILKPMASYTDAARRANIQGTVRLRVTFAANGGIGKIDVISELPYGLTEQAVAAAGKIFFIPANRNGKPIAVVKIVEYSFSIY